MWFLARRQFRLLISFAFFSAKVGFLSEFFGWAGIARFTGPQLDLQARRALVTARGDRAERLFAGIAMAPPPAAASTPPPPPLAISALRRLGIGRL